MYSYTEFKEILDDLYDFSEKEIFYIIGMLFDKTDGFKRSHREKFYNLKADAVVYIEWSIKTYGWDIEIDRI